MSLEFLLFRVSMQGCNFVFSVFSTFLPPKEVRERSKKFPGTARIHFGQVSSKSDDRRPKNKQNNFSKQKVGFNDYLHNDYLHLSVDGQLKKTYKNSIETCKKSYFLHTV